MPIQRDRYPANWEEIALRIKQRAGWRCAECGRHCYLPGERSSSRADRMALAERIRDAGEWSGSVAALMMRIGVAPRRFILTVAHLDHNPGNCTPSNLRALCPECHLRYDHAMHVAHASATLGYAGSDGKATSDPQAPDRDQKDVPGEAGE